MEDYRNKINSIMYGAALGDAVGLLTEMKRKEEVQEMYPKKSDIIFPPPEPIRGFTLGDWTDETDQLIVVMDTLRECMANNRLQGYPNRRFVDPEVNDLRLKTDAGNRIHMPVKDLPPENLFAYKLKFWVTEGFPAVGDDAGKGCESIVYQTATRVGFIKNPVGIARNIWIRNNKSVTNSCVSRTAIIGILDDFPTVFKLTERFCLSTHPDPRNVAACMVVTYLIFTFTHHKVPKSKLEDIIMLAVNHGKQILTIKKHRHQLEKYCYSSLKDLALDKEGVTDFAFRALGCGIWALRYVARAKNKKNLFVRTIRNIILEGGDADCNACTAGALLGAWLGFNKLPNDWIEALPHRGWLDQLIDKFVKVRFNQDVDEESEDYSLESSGEEESSSSYDSDDDSY